MPRIYQNICGVLLALTPLLSMAAEPGAWQISGSYRLRYEWLENSFRANATGGDQLLLSRLLASIGGKGENFFAELEIQDSRAWLGDRVIRLVSNSVNALEPLQIYAGWHQDLNGGRQISVKAGRMTMDVGSRRLVARNRYRNTLNAFSGVHGQWDHGNWHGQAFFTYPVQREPFELAKLGDNRAELDDQYSDIRFWGLHYAYAPVSSRSAEMYYFGLHEEDQPELPTRNRRIHTVGLRFLKPAAPDDWDYEIETAYQYGESHASRLPSDVTDLDHRAWFMHAHLGFQFADHWSSRIVLQFDYASGDKRPDDKQNNRFDTLYGARRFDFGPTGIYGVFARGNILSPGLRWEIRNGGKYTGLVGYRAVWLAERFDALTTSGVRNVGGTSDKFVGHQLEAALRAKLGDQLEAEAGAAYLRKGSFLRHAPNAPDEADTLYLYSQITYFF